MKAPEEGFRIELRCPDPQWWRFNVELMCGCFDASGERTGFASAADDVAPVGSGLKSAPAGYPADRRSTLVAAACDRLTLYVYIIPHALPADREVDACRPFAAELTIRFGGKLFRRERIEVNQWSGASAELTVERP